MGVRIPFYVRIPSHQVEEGLDVMRKIKEMGSESGNRTLQ